MACYKASFTPRCLARLAQLSHNLCWLLPLPCQQIGSCLTLIQHSTCKIIDDQIMSMLSRESPLLTVYPPRYCSGSLAMIVPGCRSYQLPDRCPLHPNILYISCQRYVSFHCFATLYAPLAPSPSPSGPQELRSQYCSSVLLLCLRHSI